MNTNLALALALMLAGSCFGKAEPISVEEQAHAIAANSAVEVKFLDGSHQRGLIGTVSDTGFELDQGTKGLKSQVSFDQVKTVKHVNSVKPGHTTRNVLIGVGVGFFVFVAYVGAHT
jgi:hypothetical protein